MEPELVTVGASNAGVAELGERESDPAVNGLLEGMRLAELPPLSGNEEELGLRISDLGDGAASLREDESSSVAPQLAKTVQLGCLGVDMLWSRQDDAELRKLLSQFEGELTKERDSAGPNADVITTLASLVAYAESRLAQLSTTNPGQ